MVPERPSRRRPHPAVAPRATIRPGLVIPLLAALAGCDQPAEIRHYSVPKPPPAVRPTVASDRGMGRDEILGATPAPDATDMGAAEGEPGQILGAIIPRGNKAWFLKITGPADAVKAQARPFVDFLNELRFEEGLPTWTLPEGWTQLPGNEFRFATLKLPGAPYPLELTVSSLPLVEKDFDRYLLQNINRWREQLQAPPLQLDQLEKATLKQTFGDVTAWLVLIEGILQGRSRPATPESRSPARGAADQSSVPFAYDLPVGWVRKPAGMMQIAQYELQEGDQKIVISVSTAGGKLLDNVNRWRGQVQLPPIAAQELQPALQKLNVGGLTGQYVQLVGPEGAPGRKTILGVIVTVSGQQWFFKLLGDSDLAQREQSKFEAFVRSIRFDEDEQESKSNGQ